MSEQEFPQSPTGCWIITRLFSKTGAPIDVKSSGTNTKAAIDDLYSGITYGIEHYGWQPEAPKAPPAPAPKPDAAAEIAREEGNLELASMLAEIPSPPAGKTWQMVDVQEVRVIPQPDGVTTLVEFWNPNRKYAEERVKWKSHSIIGLLKYVMTVPTNDDGTPKAAAFTAPCRVYYSLGKEYVKKDQTLANYHDVAHVRPL